MPAGSETGKSGMIATRNDREKSDREKKIGKKKIAKKIIETKDNQPVIA
jgi:hypothetical protein